MSVEGGLEQDLRSPDPDTRRQALLTLAEVKKDRKLLRVFIEVSQTDEDPSLRELALQLAERYVDDVSGPIEIPKGGVKEVLAPPMPAPAPAPSPPPAPPAPARPPPTLEEILESGETLQKLEAIRRAQTRGDAATLDLLKRRLESESDLWVVSNLLKAIGVLGDANSIGVIQPFLKHADARVQANAIEALEAIGDELSFALVAPLLGSQDPRIRANAIKCLMRVNPDEALETLWRMARSEQPTSRDSALYCMGLIEHERVPEVLVEMAEVERDIRLLEKQVALLGEVGGKEAVGILASFKDGRSDTVGALAAEAFTRCVERGEVGLDTVAELKVAFETRGEAGAGGGPDGDGPDLPPLKRATANVPASASPDASPPGERRKRDRRKGGKPPPPDPGFAGFARENPLTIALFGVVGLFLVGSAAVVFQSIGDTTGADKGGAAPVQIIRQNRPAATKAPETTTDSDDVVSLDCIVDHVDRRRKTALLKNDDQLILALLPKAPPDDLGKGDGVTVRGFFTGKMRFGAKYFKAKDLRKR